MAQMLKDYQSNYVLDFVSENKKEVVVTVPVPGNRYSKRDYGMLNGHLETSIAAIKD